MNKIRLVGLESQKHNILNALHRTGAVELSETKSFADLLSFENSVEKEELVQKHQLTGKAIDFYNEQLSISKGKDYYPKSTSEYLSDIFVNYDDFSKITDKEKDYYKIVLEANELENKLVSLRSNKIKILNLLQQLEPYALLDDKFSELTNTKTSKVFFGTIKLDIISQIEGLLSKFEFTSYSIRQDNKHAVIIVASINEEADEVLTKITELGFSRCNFNYDTTASEKILALQNEIAIVDLETENVAKQVCSNLSNINSLKLLFDYYYFLIEKENYSEKFRRTKKTFVLEGYVPKLLVEDVKKAIYGVSEDVFVEFADLEKGEEAPVLTKNSKMIKQAEFITDLYSTPNYHEIDPNRVVFFFFMLFMGIIMADVGYGILMIGAGLYLASRIKVDNGTRRLWNIIAMGGVSSIIFGLLFNSFFGVALPPPMIAILPSPTPDLETGVINLETVMTLLLASLGLGVLQLAVGYFYKALNCFKNGDIVDGICDGILWVLFFIGLVLAAFNFLLDYLNVSISNELRAFFDKMSTPGLIIVISSVVLAAITAGRQEKGFGKFSKGFGAVYGIINILSDVLSYARLFGLMLSGMIIAQTFNYKLGLPLIEGGGVGIVFGALVIVVGHLFNIVMNVLGAYIHDSRLQYIEFFSKFYTGEGEKFTPLASNFEYIYLRK